MEIKSIRSNKIYFDCMANKADLPYKIALLKIILQSVALVQLNFHLGMTKETVSGYSFSRPKKVDQSNQPVWKNKYDCHHPEESGKVY